MDKTQFIIERYGLEQNPRGATLEVPTRRFYTGHTYMDTFTLQLPAGYAYQEGWSDGYREVWASCEDRAIFTYVEGDLDLTIDETDEEFDARLESARKFYEEARV